MFIKPTKDASGNLFDIHDATDEILLYPVREDIPCPWDAEIEVTDDGHVVLKGTLSEGGFGYCECDCLISEFTKYYKLEIPDDNDDLLNALYNAGWIRSK